MTTAPLLFDWDAPRQRNLAITGFVLASLFAHVGCFYLFQIVYPPTVSLTPAPQRVNLISASSDEGATLLRWVDAEDPALEFTTRRPSDAKRHLFGKIQHIPSYSASEPQLQAAPPLNVDLRIPSAQPVGPVTIGTKPAIKPLGIVPTKVRFSHEFDSLGQATLPPPDFRGSLKEPPQNAQFRIAVDALGVIRYCFPINSSGDAALDEQAREYLVLSRFPARSTSNVQSFVWGIATIEWGNDVASNAKSKSP